MTEQQLLDDLTALLMFGYLEIEHEDDELRVRPTAKALASIDPLADKGEPLLGPVGGAGTNAGGSLRDLRGSRESAAFGTSAAALRRLRGEDVP